MSDWRDDFGQPQSIQQAQLFSPEPPSHRSGRWVVFVLLGVVFFFLLSVGAGISVFFYMITSENAVAESFEAETAEERAAALQEAYCGKPVDVGVPREQLQAIQTLFRKVEQAAREDDDRAFVRLVNLNLMFARAERIGAMMDVPVRVKSEVKLSARESIGVNPCWQRIDIQCVDMNEDGNAAVVYSYTEGDSDDFYQFRWWLARKRGNWWICDWERVDLGLSEAEERGAYARYWDASELESYWNVCDVMGDAAELIEEAEYEKAAARLRAAQAVAVPEPLEGLSHLLFGYYYRQCGRTDKALAAFRAIYDPVKTPGAYLGMALCYDDLGLTQKTLEYARKYEELVGVDVDSSRLRANALESLGSLDEAAVAAAQILHVAPNDDESLSMLAAGLSEDQMVTLVAALDRCDQPLEKAVSVAEAMASRELPGAVDAIAMMLQTRLGGGPRVAYVQGIARSLQDDFDGAADLQLDAIKLETDAATRSSYLDEYLEVMLNADRVAEAYRSSLDEEMAGDVFDYYVSGYDYGESSLDTEGVDELLRLHRKRCPDDPWGLFYTAVREREEERYDAAIEAIETGMALTEDEDLLDEFRYERRIALDESGQIDRAYAEAEDPDEAFEEMADTCVWDERPEALRKLIETRRADSPNDPMLDYYLAQANILEDNVEEALRLLQRGLDRADSDDELLGDRYRQLLLRQQTIQGRGLEAYNNAGDDEQAEAVFAHLASEYTDKEDWQRLGELLKLHRTRCPDDAAALKWQAEQLWKSGDIQEFADRFTPWSDYRNRFEDSWRWRSVPTWLVRAYLRLQRDEDARQLAKELLESEGAVLPSVLVNAKANDIAKTIYHLVDHDPIGYTARSLYLDEDIGDLLWSEAFRPVREKFPPPWLVSSSENEVVLLLSEPLPIEREGLIAQLAPLLSSQIDLRRLPQDGDAPSSYILQGDGVRACLTLGDVPYAGRDCLDSDALQDSPLADALSKHTAYIAIAGIGHSDAGKERQQAAVKTIAGLFSADCLAAYFPDEPRVGPPGQALDDLLAGSTTLAEQEDWGESVWLYAAQEETDKQQGFFEQKKAQRELFALFRNGDLDRPIEVKATFVVDRASETTWLRVERIIRRRYGVWYACVWREDSMIDPRFQAGQPIVLCDDEVEAWRYAKDRE